MKQIKVSFHEIDYKTVCDYYNNNKPSDWEALERLDRAEGGFKINIKYNNEIEPNYNIKQLRWNQKKLVPHFNYPKFNDEELELLYKSLSHSYGNSQVFFL